MSEKLEIILHATDQASGKLREVGGELQGLGVAGKLAGLGIAAAGTALAAATAVLTKGIMEAAQMQEAMAQVDARIKSTGGSAGVTSAAVSDLANAMQRQTRYSDDAVVSAASLAMTFTNIKSDIFPDVIRLSADMATAMKTDLNSAILQVGKAMQDPITGATALRRAGVMLTDSQEAVIKALMTTGDVAGAQKIVLQELATEFEGSAIAAGQTLPGQLDILSNKLADTVENFGIILMPGLQAIADGLIAVFDDPAVAEAVKKLGTVIEENLLKTLFDLSDWLTGPAVTDIKSFVAEIQAAAASIGAFFAPLVQLDKDIKAMAGPTGFLGQLWSGITGGGNMFPDVAAGFAGGMGVAGMGGVVVPTVPDAGVTTSGKSSWEKHMENKRLRAMMDRLEESEPSASKGLTPGAHNFSMPDLGGGGSGATSAAAAKALGLPDYLARAFPNAAAAMAWQGAFAGEHGGRAAGIVDVRDKMAGDMFAAKYGRGATQGEWEERYYKGSFGGVDESGLDRDFGPNGTLATKLDAERTAAAKENQAILDAFKKAADPTYNVTVVGRRITD